jgi:hypothetical protein
MTYPQLILSHSEIPPNALYAHLVAHPAPVADSKIYTREDYEKLLMHSKFLKDADDMAQFHGLPAGVLPNDLATM